MDGTIEIPEIRLDLVVVTIQGAAPLIVQKFGERARKLIEDKQQKKATGGKSARNPEEEFRDAIYLTRDGKPGFPAAGIKKALVTAGGRFTEGKMTHLRGLFNIEGDFIEIKSSKPPQMRSDTVRLKGGVASIAYRPMFWPWEMDVPIRFNATLFSPSQLVNLFQIAGFSVGIGNWRPECNGVYGTFILKDGGIKG